MHPRSRKTGRKALETKQRVILQHDMPHETPLIEAHNVVVKTSGIHFVPSQAWQ